MSIPGLHRKPAIYDLIPNTYASGANIQFSEAHDLIDGAPPGGGGGNTLTSNVTITFPFQAYRRIEVFIHGKIWGTDRTDASYIVLRSNGNIIKSTADQIETGHLLHVFLASASVNYTITLQGGTSRALSAGYMLIDLIAYPPA